MGKTVLPISLADMKSMALVAGDIMKVHFVSHGIRRDVKEDHTPFTIADQLINAMVIERVQQIDATVDIIAEEASARTASDWQIACDPIDGTFPYTWGSPISTFMLALLHKGVVMASVIYDPFTDRMYTAERSKGAFMNEQPIQVSHKTFDENPVLGYVSWQNCGTNMHAVCGHLERHGFQLVNFCSIGYFEAMVATGELVGTIFPQRKPMSFHDTAPGHLLVEEAGGIVTDLLGYPQNYLREEFRGHIMANSIEMHNILLEAVKNYG